MAIFKKSYNISHSTCSYRTLLFLYQEVEFMFSLLELGQQAFVTASVNKNMTQVVSCYFWGSARKDNIASTWLTLGTPTFEALWYHVRNTANLKPLCWRDWDAWGALPVPAPSCSSLPVPRPDMSVGKSVRWLWQWSLSDCNHVGDSQVRSGKLSPSNPQSAKRQVKYALFVALSFRSFVLQH